MKRQILSIACCSAIALFGACGGNQKEENKSTENTTVEEVSSNPRSNEETTSSSILEDKAVLKSAEEQLKELPKFKGKDIKVFQRIHFYEDGRVVVDLQDPDKPDNIDNYTFKNGNWGDPQPVQITGSGDMESNVFPLSQIKFETVADIYKQLEEKAAEIEGAKIDNHIYYSLNVMHQTGRWTTDIKGVRESFSAYFDADGSLQEFAKK